MPRSPATALPKSSTNAAAGDPDAPCGAELAAPHLAVIAQPADELGRHVFELHYLWRVRNIKVACLLNWASAGSTGTACCGVFDVVCSRVAGVLRANLEGLQSLVIVEGGYQRRPFWPVFRHLNSCGDDATSVTTGYVAPSRLR